MRDGAAAVSKRTGFFVEPDHSDECYLAKQGRTEFIVHDGLAWLDRIGRRNSGSTTWHKFRCNCLKCDAVAYVRYDVLMVFVAGLVHAADSPRPEGANRSFKSGGA